MMETWLKPNRRVLAMSLMPPLGLIGVGLWMVVATDPLRVGSGYLLLCFSVFLLFFVVSRMCKRRLAYAGGQLLVGLGQRKPIPVPIELVECFFLGSSPTRLSGRWGLQSRAISVVVRLAERASDYHQREVLPRLGNWSDGYITIGGSWCEPVSVALVQRLNKRLSEVQRVRNAPQASAVGGARLQSAGETQETQETQEED